jgi:hypothetical protein
MTQSEVGSKQPALRAANLSVSCGLLTLLKHWIALLITKYITASIKYRYLFANNRNKTWKLRSLEYIPISVAFFTPQPGRWRQQVPSLITMAQRNRGLWLLITKATVVSKVTAASQWHRFPSYNSVPQQSLRLLQLRYTLNDHGFHCWENVFQQWLLTFASSCTRNGADSTDRHVRVHKSANLQRCSNTAIS